MTNRPRNLPVTHTAPLCRFARPVRPTGQASSERAEPTPRGAPQGVHEARWQTDTNL